MTNKRLILLNNIGSPSSSNVTDVRQYLRDFLMDPNVITLPWILRWLLVYGPISISRAPKSAVKYQKIWTTRGSPLIFHTHDLAEKLTALTKSDVKIAMRYQTPSIKYVVENEIKKHSWDEICLVPLYPQWADSTSKSSLQIFKELKTMYSKQFPYLNWTWIKPFYSHSEFISTWANSILNYDLSNYDGLLLSYHGLPKSALSKNQECQFNDGCCPRHHLNNCYRAQCVQTSELIKEHVPNNFPVFTSFQSRLGQAEWIQPYTENIIKDLPKKGIKRLLVACPAFVTDCLETLEEINIEARSTFFEKGGLKFTYISCPNSDEKWVKHLATIINDSRFKNSL